jgi:hypothetical protein
MTFKSREEESVYRRRKYAENPEAFRYKSAMRADRARKRMRTLSQKRRLIIMEILGTKCVRCGFSDSRALQIDHINGHGGAERKTFSSPGAYYQHIIDINGIGYQILCANCNIIKKIENDETNRKYFFK